MGPLSNLAYAPLALALLPVALCAAYTLAAIFSVRAFRAERTGSAAFRPPVTILKPVCGLDADLEENLRSFCLQDYPDYQVVVGVAAASDPAVPVIRRLIEELPDADIALVVDPRVSGSNLKVSNLTNMDRAAQHPYLVIADSDMRVDAHYLASVIAPFADPGVGMVTCLYAGRPAGGLASRLASMFINEQFLPSVLVSARLGPMRFALGATMAVRRELLERIGGFAALADCLADDHVLGKRVSALGYRVALSGYVVENVVREENLGALFRHELRWARTIRAVAPLGHAFSILTYGLPVAVLDAALLQATLDWTALGVALVALALALRLWLHAAAARSLGLRPGAGAAWLVPLRDLLGFLVWSASFVSNKVVWRDRTFTVDAEGLMKPVKRYEA